MKIDYILRQLSSIRISNSAYLGGSFFALPILFKKSIFSYRTIFNQKISLDEINKFCPIFLN